MSTKARSQVSIPRIPGLGFVELARRLSNSSGRRSREATVVPVQPNRNRNDTGTGRDDDGDWYIPYSGPYEPPKVDPIALKHGKETRRDSWGDPVYGENYEGDDVTALATLEFSSNRYHVDRDLLGRKQSQGSEVVRPRQRSHTHSVMTAQSTTAYSPLTRTSFASSQRRSTARPPQVISSYINLDTAGGVGESPAPLPPYKRSPSKDRDPNTLSIANILSIGSGRPGRSQVKAKSISGGSYTGNILRKLSRGPGTATAPHPSRGYGTGPNAEINNKRLGVSHRRSSSDSSHLITLPPGASPSRPRRRVVSGTATSTPANEDEWLVVGEHDHGTEDMAHIIPLLSNSTPHNTSPSQDTDTAHISTPTPQAQPQPQPRPQPHRHPYAAAVPSGRDLDLDEPPLPPDITTGSGMTSSGLQPQAQAQPRIPAQPFSSKQVDNAAKTLPRTAAAERPSASRPHFGLLFPSKSIKRSKNFASTPDLRLHSTSSSFAREKEKGLGKEIKLPVSAGAGGGRDRDRWLSPETWCDALLFPRPRLKMKVDGAGGEREKGTLRSMDPCGFQGLGEDQTQGEGEAVVSRVLAHSRSHHNLRSGGEREAKNEPASGPSSRGLVGRKAEKEKVDRPKSFSWDDMALPTPVPSLAKVLEAGERLDTERKQWRHKATHSFQNRKSRSLGRARSKSLTQKGGTSSKKQEWTENMDFLTAKAYLGKQIDMPAIKVTSPPQTAGSPTKKPTKQQQHQNHARQDSWSPSAFKTSIKPLPGGVTVFARGFGNHQKSPSADSGLTTSLVGGSERASKRSETRVIRQPDSTTMMGGDRLTPSEDTHSPTHMHQRSASHSQSHGYSVSPVSSGSLSGAGGAGVRMGIALPTPPMLEQSGSDGEYDMDSLKMPSHPYAQGGMYTSRHYVPAQVPKARDEGREKTITPGASPVPSNDSGNGLEGSPALGRGTMAFSHHPYANVRSSDRSPSPNSYVGEAKIVPIPRHDSTVPPPAKMWAPVAPGVVREVLPGEISYSPFLTGHGGYGEESQGQGRMGQDSEGGRGSADTVGMGEALAFTSRPQMNATGTENVVISNHPYSVDSSDGGRRTYRQPTQYDTGASRPYMNHTRTQETGYTLPSSGSLRLTLDPAAQQLHYQQQQQRRDEQQDQELLQQPAGHLRYGSSGSPSILHVRTTSTSPESLSPPLSPRPFDNPDALDNFHDLFYRSRNQTARQSQMSVSSLSSTPGGSRSRKCGSGLTSLAHQISEELMGFEQGREEDVDGDREFEMEGSQYSQSQSSFDQVISVLGGHTRRPTGSMLEFVFEENQELRETGSMDAGTPIASTFSSVGIPEDVKSSRASSPLQPHPQQDEQDDDLVRVGPIKPHATPPTVASPHQSSHTGQTFEPEDGGQIIDYALLDHNGGRDTDFLSPNTRHSSGLRPFSVDPLRRSYLTTSTVSRMSGLSDFPEPPTMPTGSMLDNYFDKRDSRVPSPPPAIPDNNAANTEVDTTVIKRQHRLTLGGIEEDSYYSSSSSSSPQPPISPTSHASSRS